ncbi:MAG: hypothetical protein V3W18_08195 [candidate division Zixibacteria bacterium]
MKRVIFVLLIAITAGISIHVSHAGVPSRNMAIEIEIDKNIEPFSSDNLLAVLTMELKGKGYKGDIRLIPREFAEVEEDESLVRLTLTECGWKTEKALSFPYLLNRYNRVFTLACFMELPDGKNGDVAKYIKADGSAGKQAQLMQDDRYDPDLLLDQSEKIKLEEDVCGKLARKITGLLLKNLN